MIAEKKYIQENIINKILSNDFEDILSATEFDDLCTFIINKLNTTDGNNLAPLPGVSGTPVQRMVDVLLSDQHDKVIYYVDLHEGIDAAVRYIKNTLLMYAAAAGIINKLNLKVFRVKATNDDWYFYGVNSSRWMEEPIKLKIRNHGSRFVTITITPGKNWTTVDDFNEVLVNIEAQDYGVTYLWHNNSFNLHEVNKNYFVKHFEDFVN